MVLKKEMKMYKKFKEFITENTDNKSDLIAFIKKHIIDGVSLRCAIEDDRDDYFIEYYVYESGSHKTTEYITALGKNKVTIETFYNYIGEEEEYPHEETPEYKIKYENLDIDVLEKIRELILYGNHMDLETNIR